MNIDDAGRSPYPVVFRENISVFIGAFYVSVVLDIHIPLHTGEVHTVKFSVFRCAALFLVFVESGERNHNLNTPAFVFSGRIVDGTVHMDSGAKAVHIVAIEAASAVAVRLCEKQIPYRVQNVHFKFIVMVRIGIRVNEDLEIVVKVDDRIAFC